jgi:hypothetical protein
VLIAYTVSGGMNSEGYSRLPVIAPGWGEKGGATGVAVGWGVGEGVETVGIGDAVGVGVDVELTGGAGARIT